MGDAQKSKDLRAKQAEDVLFDVTPLPNPLHPPQPPGRLPHPPSLASPLNSHLEFTRVLTDAHENQCLPPPGHEAGLSVPFPALTPSSAPSSADGTLPSWATGVSKARGRGAARWQEGPCSTRATQEVVFCCRKRLRLHPGFDDANPDRWCLKPKPLDGWPKPCKKARRKCALPDSPPFCHRKVLRKHPRFVAANADGWHLNFCPPTSCRL